MRVGDVALGIIFCKGSGHLRDGSIELNDRIRVRVE